MAEANKKENFFTRTTSRIGRWFREMRSELKKVVWPSGKTVMKNVLTVLAVTLVIGACIWVFDAVAALVIKFLLGLFA